MRRLLALPAALLVALVLPGVAHAGAAISSLSVEPSMVRDGASATGTVSLVFADGLPTTVLLFSSDPGVAGVPASVVAPAGATSVSFQITTNAAAPDTIVQIMAAVNNVPRTANLWVNAATPGGAQLSSVTVAPTSVTGGSGATGTVRFTRATDGALVQLASNNPAVSVPAEMFVSGGASTGAFAIATTPVSATTTATITARWFGVTKTTTLTLTPGAPAPADTVRITRARWQRGRLSIEATSTRPTAILSVHSRSGSFMFTLTNNGGGRYSDQRNWLDNPQRITVRSNLGGSATANVGT